MARVKTDLRPTLVLNPSSVALSMSGFIGEQATIAKDRLDFHDLHCPLLNSSNTPRPMSSASVGLVASSNKTAIAYLG